MRPLFFSFFLFSRTAAFSLALLYSGISSPRFARLLHRNKKIQSVYLILGMHLILIRPETRCMKVSRDAPDTVFAGYPANPKAGY
jgi:hypothetical protein